MYIHINRTSKKYKQLQSCQTHTTLAESQDMIHQVAPLDDTTLMPSTPKRKGELLDRISHKHDPKHSPSGCLCGWYKAHALDSEKQGWIPGPKTVANRSGSGRNLVFPVSKPYKIPSSGTDSSSDSDSKSEPAELFWFHKGKKWRSRNRFRLMFRKKKMLLPSR